MATTSTPVNEQLEAMKAQKSVMDKLGKIQKELFVPKENTNTFGGYNYRSCENILTAVKPLCEKYKCVLRLGDAIPVFMEGRFYIKTMVQLYDLESCTATSATAYAREVDDRAKMDGSQITGSAISYARKYALAGLFCIDNEKDADALNNGETTKNTPTKAKPEKKEEPTTISAEQINTILSELNRTGIGVDVILSNVKKKKIELMTQEDYKNMMARLKVTPDKED